MVYYKEEEEDAVEESLSLRNLPMNTNDQLENKDILANFCTKVSHQLENQDTLANFYEKVNDHPENKDFLNPQYHQPSTETSDLFEFLTNLDSQISHAEDIFFRGKILPLQQQNLFEKGFHRQRCQSVAEPRTIDQSRSNTTETRFMRNSRSLDYSKTNKDSSLRFETPNIKSSPEKFDASGVKISKPTRWYLMLFGLVKFPQEMDLHDIKTRQIRRKPGRTMFPLPSDSNQTAKVNYQHDRRSSWDLLGMLSCKSHASVAVTVTCTPRDTSQQLI